MIKPLVPDQLLPPGVKDERQQAYIRALDSGLKTIDIQTFIMSDADTVDAKLLPYLAREFSMQEFIEPGLKDAAVRKLIGRSYELHSKKGYIEGVRLGLDAIGVQATWVQWWQEEPKAHHNTHKVSVFFDEILFDDSALGDHRHRNAVTRIIEAMKRWSQDVAITFGVRTKVNHYMGVIASHGARYVAALPDDDPALHPNTQFTGAASLFGGTHQAGMEVS